MKVKDRGKIFLTAFGLSDVGLVRDNNEDSFLLADLETGLQSISNQISAKIRARKGTLLMVADGMGGAEAGEVASGMAVKLVCEHLSSTVNKKNSLNPNGFAQALQKSVEHANALIHNESVQNESRKGMGTTVTAAAILGDTAYFAQVGDSRGYLIRDESITQVTEDQSLVAQLVASGAISV